MVNAKHSVISKNRPVPAEEPAPTVAGDGGGTSKDNNARVGQAETRTGQTNVPAKKANIIHATSVWNAVAGWVVPGFPGNRDDGRDAGVCP
jgi:hypothetical protein